MKQITDIALIAQVITLHDKRAFGRLVEKYQSTIRRFFLNQTSGNQALSDDLAQETFIKAYQRIASFQSLSGFSTWLYRIAYNVFYDYMRTVHHTEDLENQQIDTCHHTNSNFSDAKADIYKALQTLNENERICVTLFYMDDVSINKIADITHISTNTIKSHLARGKKHLAIWLKNNGYETQ